MKYRLILLAVLVSVLAISCTSGRGATGSQGGCHMKKGYVGY